MLKTREFEDRKKISRQETIDLLNEHKESLFKDIANNVSYRQIAENYNIHLTNLHHYLNLEENQQAKELALKIASYDMLESAESELHKIQDESHNATVRRQCELYQHKMYIAKIKNKKELDLNYKSQETQTNNNNIITPQLTLKVVNNSDKLTITNEND
jgi:hypothetical protein